MKNDPERRQKLLSVCHGILVFADIAIKEIY